MNLQVYLFSNVLLSIIFTYENKYIDI